MKNSGEKICLPYLMVPFDDEEEPENIENDMTLNMTIIFWDDQNYSCFLNNKHTDREMVNHFQKRQIKNYWIGKQNQF